MPVVQADRRTDLRYLVQVDTFPVDIADKQQLTLGMVDDMDRIVRTEILQDRHDDSTVGDCSQIHSHPVAVVLAHHGNLVVFLDAAFLKEDMQLLDIDGPCGGYNLTWAFASAIKSTK